MTLPGLLLLVILTCCDAAERPDSGRDDCNENGPWWPLFKPSPIIHSEFPEHAQNKAQDEEQYTSYEQPPQEPIQHASQEQQPVDEEPQVVSIDKEIGSNEAAGIDSEVKTYNSQGKHRIEWDHYGDVSHVTTVAYNSLEERQGVALDPPETPEQQEPQEPAKSLEVEKVSEEEHSDSAQEKEEVSNKDDDVPEEDTSNNSQEENFFNEGSFFEQLTSSQQQENFPEIFEISKESSLSNEGLDFGKLVEHMNPHGNFGQFSKPVATSYSSMSSIFANPRPVTIKSRDLLHPDITYNDVPNYINNQIQSPFNGKNTTKQYFVHELQSEDPGTLVINHLRPPGLPSGRSSQPYPFVPLDHPVYRYVKNHGGLSHHYRRQPFSRASSLRWQEVRPELRNSFPFKHLQPYVHMQNHETLIHHVMPTKDPFSDNYWKESKKIEVFKPPPLGQTLYYYKKKPNTIDYKKIARRQGQNYVYIIKRNTRIS